MRGKLITFEGCEGVGKSTQMRKLKEYLDSKNIQSVMTREPGGSKLAEKIRGIILDKDNAEMCGMCEILLYLAARAQHIEEIIRPNIENGITVICDRYMDSTFAYQGVARNLGADLTDKLNNMTVGEFVPDLTIFLDLPPRITFKRKGGADKNDRLENLDISFHEKVYDGYKKLLELYPKRFKSVDASGAKQETQAKIIELVDDILEIK